MRKSFSITELTSVLSKNQIKMLENNKNTKALVEHLNIELERARDTIRKKSEYKRRISAKDVKEVKKAIALALNKIEKYENLELLENLSLDIDNFQSCGTRIVKYLPDVSTKKVDTSHLATLFERLHIACEVSMGPTSWVSTNEHDSSKPYGPFFSICCLAGAKLNINYTESTLKTYLLTRSKVNSDTLAMAKKLCDQEHPDGYDLDQFSKVLESLP